MASRPGRGGYDAGGGTTRGLGGDPGPRRGAAREAKNAAQARRLLAIAAVYEGKQRSEAARVGAMDRQTLRDWVHRFNAAGPAGLIDGKAPGAKCRLTAEQEAELAALIEAGPDCGREGVVRWRLIDLQRLIMERWGVAYHQSSVGRLVRRLGFRRLSARPRHFGQEPAAIERFKKLSRSSGGDRSKARARYPDRGVVSRRGTARPEEQDNPALGTARYPTARAGRSAHQISLSIRRDLPRAGHWGGDRHAAR
jgi:transposase